MSQCPVSPYLLTTPSGGTVSRCQNLLQKSARLHSISLRFVCTRVLVWLPYCRGRHEWSALQFSFCPTGLAVATERRNIDWRVVPETKEDCRAPATRGSLWCSTTEIRVRYPACFQTWMEVLCVCCTFRHDTELRTCMLWLQGLQGEHELKRTLWMSVYNEVSTFTWLYESP